MPELERRRWVRMLRAVARSEISIDRTGTAGADLDRTHWGINGRVAYWAIVAAFGFALPTLAAISTLLNGPPDDATVDAGELIFFSILTPAITAVLAGIAVARWRPKDRVRPSWRTQVATFPVYLAVVYCAASFMLWLGDVSGSGVNRLSDLERADGDLELLREISSGLAGPSEELALMALLVAVGRGAGWRWGLVVAVAVAVRVPFHLYYGWSAIAFALWAALVVLLYRRTGALLAIVLAHSAWNLGSLLLPLDVLAAAQRSAAAIGAAVVVSVLTRAIVLHRRGASREQNEAARAAAS